MTIDRILEVRGTDAELAAVLTAAAPTRVRFVPDPSSDLARTLGWTARGATEPVTIDALGLDNGLVAVSTIVLGTAPDHRRVHRLRPGCRVEIDGRPSWDGPATTVLIANGEYLRGRDVVPRGHPGDGRLEVHVYALGRREWRQMHARLATGTHLPHPQIRTGQGTLVAVAWDRPVLLEADGVEQGRAQTLTVRLLPKAATLVP